MTSARIALAQMHVVAGERSRNLQRADELIAEAAARGADLVVLPEAMDIGWTHPRAAEAAEPVPDGAVCRRLAAAADRHGIHVCSGLTERVGETIYNSAVLIDSGGRLMTRHRKVNELEVAQAAYAKGDALGVVETTFGRVGLMICADGFARDHLVSRALGYMGAEIILSPCAWAVPAGFDQARTPYGGLWLDCYGPVAREFGLWIVAVSNVGALDAGPWAGRHCIGSSMVIGPDGHPVVRGPFGADAETLLFCEIPVAVPLSGKARWRHLSDHP